MDTLLTIVHVVVCLLLVTIVLLQHGKGADIGASFGGSSQSLFGTEGPVPLLNKITTAVAILFMVTSVCLAYISANLSDGSVMVDATKKQVEVERIEVKTDEIKEIPIPVTPEESGTEKPLETPDNK